MKKPKDLPAPPKDIKGGRVFDNSNITLVRGAKPKKKDLPARKPVTGGRIVN